MKRKLAILMASMMALTTPMSAFAGYFSAPSLGSGRVTTVLKGDPISSNIYLEFDINSVADTGDIIEAGTEIRLNLDGGKYGNTTYQEWAEGKDVSTVLADETKIVVTATSEKGSTFTVTIPYSRHTAAATLVQIALNDLRDNYDEVEGELEDYDLSWVCDEDFYEDTFGEAEKYEYDSTNIASSGTVNLSNATITPDLTDTTITGSVILEMLLPGGDMVEVSVEDTTIAGKFELKLVDGTVDGTVVATADTSATSSNMTGLKVKDLTSTNSLEVTLSATWIESLTSVANDEQSGTETIEIEGVEFDVDYTYTPANILKLSEVFAIDTVNNTVDKEASNATLKEVILSVSAADIGTTYGMPYKLETYPSNETRIGIKTVNAITENKNGDLITTINGLSTTDVNFKVSGKELKTEIDTKDVEIKLSSGSVGFLVNMRGVVSTSNTGDIAVSATSMNDRYAISSSSDIVIANNMSTSVSTELSVDSAPNFSYTLDFDDVELTIKEKTLASFEETGEVTLQLSSGFEFDSNGKWFINGGGSDTYEYTYYKLDSNGDYELDTNNDKITVTEDVPYGGVVTVDSSNPRKAKFEITEKEYMYTTGGIEDFLETITITGLTVIPTSDDILGSVTLTVSGDPVSTESIIIGKKGEYGFSLTTPDIDEDDELEVPLVIAGRQWMIDKDNLSKTNNMSAVVRFEEILEDSFNEKSALDFTVPEGVKIVNVEMVGIDNFYEGINSFKSDPNVKIMNEGQTFRVTRGSLSADENKLSALEFKLELSVDPYFPADGELNEDDILVKDIVLTATNGNLDAEEVVIATTVMPFKFDVDKSYVNYGSTLSNVKDITITENYPGMFLEGQYVYVALDSAFGDSELGFSSYDLNINSDELELRRDSIVTYGDKKVIRMEIKSASGSEPASIELTNVKVGATRAVPIGSYDIIFFGDAILNNYLDDINSTTTAITGNSGPANYDTDGKLTNQGDVNVIYQDNAWNYKINDYVETLAEGVGGATENYDQEKFEGVVAVEINNANLKKEVNGVPVETKPANLAPFVKTIDGNPTTIVPVRAIAEAIGAEVDFFTDLDGTWTSEGFTYVTYAYFDLLDGTRLTLTDHPDKSNTVVFNDVTSQQMAVPVQNENGNFFVPLRALGDLLGINVHWENGSNVPGVDSTFGTNGTAFYYSTKSELNAFLKKHYGVEEEVEEEEVVEEVVEEEEV